MRKFLVVVFSTILSLSWVSPVLAQSDLPIHIAGWITQSVSEHQLTIQSLPNDPLYSKQWYLQRIGAPAAWDITQGTNLVIAVIDTGIDLSHPELAGKLWVNQRETPNNNKDDDGNGYADDYYGYNFFNDTNNIIDANGHGTGIASIIAAKTNNSTGIAGIDWNARLMILKALDDNGGGDFQDIAQAIRYAVDNGASIINMSFGSASDSAILSSAVNYSVNRGVPMIAAVGNRSGKPVYFPAAYPNVIAVTAVDAHDQHPPFASVGEGIDLSAPGTDITMAGLVNGPTGDYMIGDGTSFATAQVTAAAALMLGRFSGLSPSVLESALKGSSDVINSGSQTTFGAGILNIPKLLAVNSVTERGDVSIANGVVVADGVNFATVTVTVRDDVGHAKPNQEILVRANGSNVLINGQPVSATGTMSLGQSNLLGQISFRVASTVPGSRELTFTNNTTHSSLTVKAPIQFTAPSKTTYAMKWVGQSPYPRLVLGATQDLWVEVKNTGNVMWISDPQASLDGHGIIKLGTDRPLDRISSFTTDDWLSANRVTYMAPNVVLPGGTVRFTFPIKASQVGHHREYFRPVVEYASWLNDLGIYWDISVEPVNGLTTQTDLNSVSSNPVDYQLTIVNQSGSVTLRPGDTAQLSVTVVNLGQTTWQAQGAGTQRLGEVRIGTATPLDRVSPFRYLSWISNNRIINAGVKVPPGGQLTLSFMVRAPSQPGSYQEEFRFVAEHVTWFGPMFGWTITVQ
ncbi:hypothetical protein A3K24_01640 [candidate division Kazan bacterium RIFCSPHIGHO2_01_FULL_44_14]|uniref:Peptidase S8/S53 domain-containing protein n=1 Tax=candidate division Kazan bacterium RIFCSPLOWO2_01_FULL_45_19 TaxID=1798538 RepID=A0A1F4NQ14_UNCK3|nr:hypothetical protein [uncultured bacterium]OGB73539.1 MAG: hypothetical protein A3K51_01640 [candidate division Kazan bacterium RIFCSPLOWO2_01_FULL_45_19]OGB77784.1 MAG: hypothetical protein A3K24_01640 [candidate division Kazan bacterium RIFCSPHIGHO2_01_FULL_44_14]